VQAVSGQYLFGDEANLQPPTPAYIVASLRGSLKPIGPLTVFGEVTNLFDGHFASFGTFSETDGVYLREAPGASNPRSLSPGAPRRFTVGIKAGF
jgi:hypothetical protein